MSFTGKATYTAGAELPEIAEDISDLVGISSPAETPLLDALGDPLRPARSTIHEWLEDELLPNSDVIDQATFVDPVTQGTIGVEHADRFREGDQVAMDGSGEVMIVSAVDTQSSTVTFVRGYGGTAAQALVNDKTLRILGNAALEGADAGAARFTTRIRRVNYTQIFSSTVEVSGSELAVRQVGVADELDYAKQQRTRELMRDLENCVVNGRSAALNPEGSASVRRTMKGLLSFITTNRFTAGANSFPDETAITEEQLNLALREIWNGSAGQVDLIVVGGTQKRAINGFLTAGRQFTAATERYKDLVSIYESDFGVCRIVLSRWVPPGAVLLLDSSRIEVMPLAGRSFAYKPLAVTGDRQSGQVIGEYTLEMRNENAHGVILGLAE